MQTIQILSHFIEDIEEHLCIVVSEDNLIKNRGQPELEQLQQECGMSPA